MATVQLRKEAEVSKKTEMPPPAAVVSAEIAPPAEGETSCWGDRVMIWVWGLSFIGLAVLTAAEILVRQLHHQLRWYWN
jgi:hypothetical protein